MLEIQLTIKSCSVQAFKDPERGRSKQRLFEAIERYFQGGVTSVEDRIHRTDLPPIYLQHPGKISRAACKEDRC